jgi:hypothetical protein
MTDEAKRKPGRPPFKPTDMQRATVKAMAAYGVPQFDISKVVGVDEKTLRLHFGQELEIAGIEANAKVAQTLFKMATDPKHPKAAICAMFWLKCRAGWSEQPASDPVEYQSKKEAASRASATAERGTDWEGLLN